MSNKKITIGLLVYDDYDGVYFTIQSLRLQTQHIKDRIEFVIINNNPKGSQSDCLRNFINKIDVPSYYVEFGGYSSTALRSKIFDIASTDYVLVLDSHVLLDPDAVQLLLDFYDEGSDDGNLIQGPLLYDDFKHISTHFDLEWNHHMWGVWGTDARGLHKHQDPFEIPAQGLGLFSCRKDSWLGFNPKFRGFGGEEGYIHEKYRLCGKKTLCLPFLRWVHRFERPNGVPYTNDIKQRYTNYMIGFKELGLDTQDVDDAFKDIIDKKTREQCVSNIA